MMKGGRLFISAGSIILLVVLVALSVLGCQASTTPAATTPAATSPATTQATTTQATASTQAAPAQTLEIGHLVALTEWFSVYDIAQARETQAVADILNSEGGITIKGQRYNIKLKEEDFKSSLDGTAAAAKRLTSSSIKFALGPMGFFSSASSPVFEQAKILHVSTYNTCQPGEMDQTTPYGFLGENGGVGEFIGTMEAMKKVYPSIKSIVIITPDDGQIPYIGKQYKKYAEKAGYTVIGELVGYPNEMADFTPIAAKLNTIKEADAYVQTSGPITHSGNIIKSLREVGNTKPYIVCNSGNCNDIATVAGSAAATNVLSGGYTPGAVDNPPYVDQIYKILEPKYGKNSMNLYNANGLFVLAKAIEAAQSLDPEAVKTKWETLTTVDTIFGLGYIGGKETYGINHAVTHPHAIQRLMDGKVTSFGWVEVSAVP
jgi:ABC-type branched-subunit amino acid transport system substrate-binding protein